MELNYKVIMEIHISLQTELLKDQTEKLMLQEMHILKILE